VHMLRFRLAQLTIPLLRHLPRGYARAYKLVLGSYLSSWKADPYLAAHIRRRRFRVHWDSQRKAYFIVDLADWACRPHYFIGRYYDEIVPMLVDTFLQDGGTFVDIGANRGIHTLYAAKRLQGKGMVYAFEPHPKTFKVLEAHLTMNQIENVAAFNAGLSDEAGTLTLYGGNTHSGTASLLSGNSGEGSSASDVEIWRLADRPDLVPFRGDVLVKIDTEGYELHVLKGMGSLLDYPQLTVVAEVTDRWLGKAGGSAREMFDYMRAKGFQAYLPRIQHRVLRKVLALERIEGPRDEEQYDVVFQRM